MKTRFFLIFLFVFFFANSASAQEAGIQTSAKQAIVVDYHTGAVLYEKNADERMPTSSMSKVMSMYMVFDALKNGAITLEDKFPVSEEAWRKGGSKMFVEVNKQVKVEDLIRGVAVQSGNDATIVLAEGLSGSEIAFAENLNLKAKELGMNNSRFMNASGWPDPDHYSTARDLATLSKALVSDFPEYYPYFAEQEFTYNSIKQGNRNPLLYRNVGADGIKTGHTEDGGYGLMGSGIINGRRVIIVVNGLEDEKARAQESSKLLEWGLQRFANYKILAKGDPVSEVSVVLGKQSSVPATIDEDLTITLPKAAINDFKVSAKFMEPLVAPVAKGIEIGKLVIEIPGQASIEKPLYASESVEEQALPLKIISKVRLFFSHPQGVE